jgi:gas vesicle protein
MRKLIAFLAGTALGSLMGVALAMLFAPSSGEELRLKAQTRYQEIRTEITEAGAARRAELEQNLQALRSPNKPVEPKL